MPAAATPPSFESKPWWPSVSYICDVPKFSLPFVEGGRVALRPRFYNWNPFIFGGKHGGSIARVSNSVLINITMGGGLLPTLRVRPEP